MSTLIAGNISLKNGKSFSGKSRQDPPRPKILFLLNILPPNWLECKYFKFSSKLQKYALSTLASQEYSWSHGFSKTGVLANVPLQCSWSYWPERPGLHQVCTACTYVLFLLNFQSHVDRAVMLIDPYAAAARPNASFFLLQIKIVKCP